MSLFADGNQVLRESEENLNQIVIDGVRGILKEPLKFSVESDWEPLISLSDRFQTVQTGISFFGGSRLFNTGIWTKRFWKGGSYLKINPSMRIIDKEGTGNVLRDSRRLLDLALPRYKSNKAKSDSERIMEDISYLAKGAKNVIKKTAENIIEGELLPNSESITNAGKGFGRFIENVASSGPKPVRVKVSNFFEKIFIIESVDVEFSKEMTDLGPLYADLNIVLSSQEVTTKGDTGLSNGGSNKPTIRRE